MLTRSSFWSTEKSSAPAHMKSFSSTVPPMPRSSTRSSAQRRRRREQWERSDRASQRQWAVSAQGARAPEVRATDWQRRRPDVGTSPTGGEVAELHSFAQAAVGALGARADDLDSGAAACCYR